MSYLGSWKIDDYLIIPAATHRFSSGAAYAPTVLTYTIYEDISTSHLVEDVDMVVAAPFDSIVGFYLAQKQLTAAAGFEKGKCYTIVIKATVDSVAAISYHTFQIEAEVDANVVSDKTGYSLADGAITAAVIATDAIDADAIKADAITEIQSGLATAAALTVVDDFLDTEIAAILADTNELQTDLVNGGRLDLLIDAIKAKTDNLPADPADDSDIDAQLATIAGYLDTEIAAILADTNELQTDLVNGGRLDLLIDAIKAKTDNLPTDPADDSDIDAQLATIAGYLDTEVAAIKAKTDLIPASPAAVGSEMALEDGAITAAKVATDAIDADALAADALTEIFSKVFTTALTESYAADGAAPTAAQALFAILQILSERSIVSTTMTVKKLDGSTTAMTFTLNDATSPTAITRAT